MQTGEVEVGCNGLSTLQRTFWNVCEDISSAQAHFDILSGLYGIKRGAGETWRYRHIAGNQEDVAGALLD